MTSHPTLPEELRQLYELYCSRADAEDKNVSKFEKAAGVPASTLAKYLGNTAYAHKYLSLKTITELLDGLTYGEKKILRLEERGEWRDRLVLARSVSISHITVKELDPERRFFGPTGQEDAVEDLVKRFQPDDEFGATHRAHGVIEQRVIDFFREIQAYAGRKEWLPEWHARFLNALGHNKDSLPYYEQALSQVEKAGHVRRTILILPDFANAQHTLKYQAAADASLATAIDLATSDGYDWGLNRALLSRFYLRLHQGRFEDILQEHRDNALFLRLKKLRDDYGMAKYGQLVAYTLLLLDRDLSEAHGLAEMSVERSERAIKLGFLASPSNRLSDKFLQLARDFWPLGSAWRKAYAHSTLGDIIYRLGLSHVQAKRHYDQGRYLKAPVVKLSLPLLMGVRYREECDLYLGVESSTVLAGARRQQRFLESSENFWDYVIVTNVLGRLYLQLGDLSEAWKNFDEARKASTTVFPYEHYEALLGLAEVAKRSLRSKEGAGEYLALAGSLGYSSRIHFS
jgi:tetratricopeptide (TPR) repeat protein